MWRRLGLLGIGIWIAGTLAIRLAGHRLLSPNQAWRTVILYLISFVLMAFLVRLICRGLRLGTHDSIKAAAILILPTLVLDPFSSLFFTAVFPNLDPAAAGAFGGWMLICCGGAVSGVLIRS